MSGLGFKNKVYPFLFDLVLDEGTNGVIEAPKEHLAPIQKRGFCPKAGENTGEFHGDITTANNRDFSRKLRQIKGFVGTDRMLNTGNFRHIWPTASGHENIARGHCFTAYLNRMSVQ